MGEVNGSSDRKGLPCVALNLHVCDKQDMDIKCMCIKSCGHLIRSAL